MCAARKTSQKNMFFFILFLLLLVVGIVVVMVRFLPSLQGVESSSASQPETTPAVSTPAATTPGESSAPPQTSAPKADPAELLGKPLPETPKVEDDYFDDAMFVGDSITTGIEGYGVMPNALVIASTGINPSSILSSPVIETANGTKTILQAMANYNPKKIYIMLGSNGVQFIGKETMMELYGNFLDAVRGQHPGSIIYLQSICPITQSLSSVSPDLTNDKIDAYNEAIMALAKEKKVYYLDVASSLKDANGALPEEASPNDGMHFGTPRYQLWMDYLRVHTVDSLLPAEKE